MMKMNKKGSFLDVLFYPVLALGFFITFILMNIIINMTLTLVSTHTIMAGDAVFADFSARVVSSLGAMDGIFFFAMIVFMGYSLYQAHKVSTDSTVFVIFIVVMFLLGFVGNFVQDMWGEFILVADVATVVSGLTFIPYFMANMMPICIIFAIGMAISLITRPKENDLFAGLGGEQ